MAEHDDDVVDAAFAVKLFGAGGVWQAHGAVISKIIWRVTPAIIRAKRIHDQVRFGYIKSIGAVETIAHMICAQWRLAITLAALSEGHYAILTDGAIVGFVTSL